jgi:hypothetical protein
MADSQFLIGYALVGLTSTVILATLLAAGLMRPGPRRAGLVAGGLPLALLVPVLATIWAAFKLIGAFSGFADPHGGVQTVMEACASLWLLLRVAWGGAAVVCLFGLLLGLARFGGRRDAPPCSVRRGLVLLLLPLLGLVTAGVHTQQLARGLRVSVAVTAPGEDDPEGQRASEAILAAEGLRARGSSGIAEVSSFITRSMLFGSGGGFVALVVLLGLASTGFILAWRVRIDGKLLLAASAVWGLAIVSAGLVALGVFDPLRLS